MKIIQITNYSETNSLIYKKSPEKKSGDPPVFVLTFGKRRDTGYSSRPIARERLNINTIQIFASLKSSSLITYCCEILSYTGLYSICAINHNMAITVNIIIIATILITSFLIVSQT
jgi:hypothetical protein